MSKVSIVSGLSLVCNAVNLHKCLRPLNLPLNRKPLFVRPISFCLLAKVASGNEKPTSQN